MKTERKLVIMGLAALCVAVLSVIGCGKDEPAAEENPAETQAVDPVTERMNDPVYLKQMDKQREGQKDALRAISAAKAELAKAEEEGAGDEEIARLKKEVEAAYLQLDANKKKSQQIIADRMRQQIQDRQQTQK